MFVFTCGTRRQWTTDAIDTLEARPALCCCLTSARRDLTYSRAFLSTTTCVITIRTCGRLLLLTTALRWLVANGHGRTATADTAEIDEIALLRTRCWTTATLKIRNVTMKLPSWDFYLIALCTRWTAWCTCLLRWNTARTHRLLHDGNVHLELKIVNIIPKNTPTTGCCTGQQLCVGA